MVMTRSGAITLGGTPTDLSGPELKAGDAAPDFMLQNNSLAEVSRNSFANKTLIIATLPSLDTPVCHVETQKFNEHARDLANVAVLVVSTDLPFGQKRWCGSEGVENVTTLSAHRSSKFGEDYGVLISGGPFDQCLARAIFVVNPEGKITYVEYVKEVGEHPKYGAALAAATS
ncbi:MAG: tpx [Planctomycetaceae bacterium]|nr:tpx [Planctomycetaceae bacterium]